MNESFSITGKINSFKLSSHIIIYLGICRFRKNAWQNNIRNKKNNQLNYSVLVQQKNYFIDRIYSISCGSLV